MSRRRRSDSGLSGCVVIDKPSGCTSHDVVDAVRRRLGTRKVGHSGTLDPDATGVLALGVGVGTKLLQFVTGVDKTYTAEVVFGRETSTLDASGETTAVHDMAGLDADAVRSAAATLTGDIEQVPPMVSAIKVDGRRLHELAREGIEVERKARPVTVHRFEAEPTEDPMVYRVAVSCSSGTYVRTLAADLGTALGGGAHLRNLRRTAVGAIAEDEAESLEDFTLRPLITLLPDIPVVQADEAMAADVSHGRALGSTSGSGLVAVTDVDGELIAVYESRDGELRPAKVLRSA